MSIKNYLFEAFLAMYSIRSFIVGPSLSDALIVISLVISMVYLTYLNKKDPSSELSTKVDMLQQEIAKIKLDQGIKKVGNIGVR